MITTKCCHLENDHLSAGIQEPRHPIPKRANDIRLGCNLPAEELVNVGRCAVIRGAWIHVGDVVLFDSGRLTQVGVVADFIATTSIGELAKVNMWRVLSKPEGEASFQVDKNDVHYLSVHNLHEALTASVRGRVRHAFLPDHGSVTY